MTTRVFPPMVPPNEVRGPYGSSAQIAAEQFYNAIYRGRPFKEGERYVQDNRDGTYTVVYSLS